MSGRGADAGEQQVAAERASSALGALGGRRAGPRSGRPGAGSAAGEGLPPVIINLGARTLFPSSTFFGALVMVSSGVKYAGSKCKRV